MTAAVQQSPSTENQLALADGYLKWGMDADVERAIDIYNGLLANVSQLNPPAVGKIHFRLGVAWRRVFDRSDRQDSTDFAKASMHWTQALDENPNQYIWRRRIEQYGPRLIKPYPFYDWVATADAEIRGRGERPIKLNVPLTRSEVAGPKRPRSLDRRSTVKADELALQVPDKDSRIYADSVPHIRLDSTTVPFAVKRNQSVAVHLSLQPNRDIDAKWNNESTSPVLIVYDDDGQVTIRRELQNIDQDGKPTSDKRSDVDFECQVKSADRTIKGYLLYNVCSGKDAICRYLRQDFEVAVNIKDD